MNTSAGNTKGGGPLELKGDVLEGMAVFDSATPRTRRGRNQRKGPEVLEQMKKNSAEVEPEEISFYPSGEFRASRDIFGPPSSEPTSPVSRFKFIRSHILILHQVVVPSSGKRKSSIVSKSSTNSMPVIQHKSAKLPVRVAKPANFVFAPGTGRRRSPSRGSVFTRNHGTNYLNQSMIGRLHSSGVTPNPFMQANNNHFAVRDTHLGDDNDFKPAPVQFTVPKSAFSYSDSNSQYDEHGAYSRNSFAFQRHDEARGGTMATGYANPLSAAYSRHDRRSPSPVPEDPQ